MKKPDLTDIVSWFKGLQDDICQHLEALDGSGRFREDLWERKEGGGGRSRVLEGQHIEKGGVMFSHIHGLIPTKIATGLNMKPGVFDATGVSIVLHASNPWVPIIHMNVRYFESGEGQWWFGGGIDATPHYIHDKEARNFHLRLKEVCDRFTPTSYEEYRNWADDYFFNKHRGESRGIGGIFFDRLSEKDGLDKSQIWQFVQNVGSSFTDCYSDLFKPNFNRTFDEEQVRWQQIRRGRYVEFNLVYDRGTRFGLETGGRIESILMSMPPMTQWVYNHKPEPGSPESETLAHLKNRTNWLKDTEE